MAKAGSGGGNYVASPPITFTVYWSLSAVDDVNYYVAVGLDTGSGYSVIGTTTTGATQLSYQHTDYVQGGSWNQITPTFTFRVQIIRRSDSAVIQTVAATGITTTIGTCNSAL